MYVTSSRRTMGLGLGRVSLSICGALAGALLIAAGPAGCGGSDDALPPLLLTQSNAPAVAAEALITAGQTTAGAQVPLGGAALTATRAVDGASRRAAQHLMSRATGAPIALDTMTAACAAGGTTTTESSSTAATVTYNNCQEDANTKINGTVKLTIKTSSGSSDFAFSVSVNLTVTAGKLSLSESGGYDLIFKSSSTGSEFELTGKRLTISVTGGTVSDKLTLSDFDIDVKADTSGTPAEQSETIDYDIDSSRLDGHISVMTAPAVTQLLDATPARQFPHAGRILITGAKSSRLQITIAGDETYVPPAGEGQVKIELDTGTGSFAAPIWVNWAMLQSLAGSAP